MKLPASRAPGAAKLDTCPPEADPPSAENSKLESPAPEHSKWKLL